jgi:hypothetical protein
LIRIKVPWNWFVLITFRIPPKCESPNDPIRSLSQRVIPCKPARIEGVEGVVAEGAVEVHIAGGVGEGVEAGPAAEDGGIVAETEVIQTTGDIVSSALVQIEPIVGAA